MATLQDLRELFANRSTASVAIEINGFTGFRTSSLEELTPEEVNRLFAIHAPKPQNLEQEFNAFKEELISKAWKSKIIALAERQKIKDAGCFHKFNNWMLTRSVYKKHLNAHNIAELKNLHRQMCALRDNNRRSAERPLTQAWWDKADKLKNYN